MSEDAWKDAQGQAIAEEEALQARMGQRACQESELYAKA
jgi:hypothetical protein